VDEQSEQAIAKSYKLARSRAAKLAPFFASLYRIAMPSPRLRDRTDTMVLYI